MIQTFTKGFMKKNKGCYDDQQLAACSFMANNHITLAEILNSEIPLEDKYWFVLEVVAESSETDSIVLYLADIALELYDNPTDHSGTLQDSLQALKDSLSGSMEKLQLWGVLANLDALINGLPKNDNVYFPARALYYLLYYAFWRNDSCNVGVSLAISSIIAITNSGKDCNQILLTRLIEFCEASK